MLIQGKFNLDVTIDTSVLSADEAQAMVEIIAEVGMEKLLLRCLQDWFAHLEEPGVTLEVSQKGKTKTTDNDPPITF